MHDKESFRTLIRDQLASLQEQESDSTDSAATVELDQSRVGRLSRMDAMQSQAMHAESLRRVRLQIQALKRALSRIDSDDFGLCEACDEEIAADRLRLNPAAVLCIQCAEKRER